MTQPNTTPVVPNSPKKTPPLWTGPVNLIGGILMLIWIVWYFSHKNDSGCWTESQIRNYETQRVQVLTFNVTKLDGCRFHVQYDVQIPPFGREEHDDYTGIYKTGNDHPTYEDR
jgi:hypothetical protein